MINKYLLLMLSLSSGLVYGQVGINNTNPKSTFHVIASKTDGTTAEGIIAPNLTRAQLITKDGQYGSDQRGAIVYVTTIDGTVTTKTTNVTLSGYYYFNGTEWVAFRSAAAVIPTEPWQVQGSTTAATSNAENIYQTGSVAIGSNSAGSYKFQVTGASNITGNSRVASSTVVGNETVGGTFGVSGAATLSNNLTVGGITSLQGANVGGTLNYQPGGTAPTANTYLRTDATGNASWQALPTTATTEPWQVQGGTTAATTNAQNIYQTGSVHVGANTAVTAYKFQVTGASNVTGNSRVGSSTVAGNQTVAGTLGVTGVTTLQATNVAGTLNYQPGGTAPTANTYLRTDATGNASWQTLPTTATTEPWQVQGGTTAATTNAQNIYQTGSVHIGANTAVTAYKFQVTGASNITGNSRAASSTVVGNETVGGTLGVTGATSLASTLAVTGTSVLTGNVGIGAASNASYKLQVTGASNITGNSRAASSTIVGNETVGGTFGVTGTSTLTGNVGIGAASNASYKLQVTGSSNITGNSRVASSTVVGNETVGGTLGVTGITNLASTLSVTGNTGLGTASPAQKLHVVGNQFTSGISKIGGTTTYNTSAQLELSDNNKGFLPNRVALTSSTVKAPVANAVDGMIVYNTATVAAQGLAPGLYYWRGTSWQRLVDEIPVQSAKMYYQTANVRAGVAAGGNQASMVSLNFSPTRATHAPAALKLPESGSYAFNVKLYSSVGNTTGPNSVVPQYSGKVVVYVGIWVNNVLQDVSEVFSVIEPRAGAARTLNGNFLTNVVLGCTGSAGDTIDIRVGFFEASLPANNYIWSVGLTSATPRSDATSLVFWKL